MLKKYLAFLTLFSLLSQALPAAAQTDSNGFEIDPEFDPNFVLSDEDMFDDTAMSRSRLISFLNSKGSLGDHIELDIDGQPKLIADIILRVSYAYKVNPKFLLAMLQKEQSLVEDPYPSDAQLAWAMGYGVCDSCSKDDPSISDFKGFANQLEYTAKQFREKYYMRYLTYGHMYSAFIPGETTIVDGIVVTPVNFATAAVYTYTPHIHGNQNLWKIWRRWFSRSYPNGTVVQGQPSGTYYWIRYGEKRPFASLTVAMTLVDIEKALSVSDSDLHALDTGTPINFPNYSLLRNSVGQIWLIVDEKRRHIVNMDTFRKFGFNMDEVEDVNDEDLLSYIEGNKITLDDMYPKGQLVQVDGLRAIWYAEGGDRYLLTHPAIWSLYFNMRRPQIITQQTLDSLTNQGTYLLHDGELVKAPENPAVFVIENGLKRSIPSEEVFLGIGYEWGDIEELPASLLDGYPEGAPILLDAGETNIASL